MTKSTKLLPRLVITELSQPNDEEATKVTIPNGSTEVTYYVRPKQQTEITAMKHEAGTRFNLFPIVLDITGAPWAEANIYLLSKMGRSLSPVMSTCASIANDLAAYRKFLDETKIDWTVFPANKLSRPTYRYHAYLKHAVADGAVAASTAKRRMSAVITFYSWLESEGTLIPQHKPWKESDRFIGLTDIYGLKFSKRVTTTDISIHMPKKIDPYTEAIDDSGKLRPLPVDEQEWLLDALITLANTEMTLIHLFGLLTGARLQTILTFRVSHVLTDPTELKCGVLRLAVGPGTGIDTKNDKRQVLHIPSWFYQKLHTYAHSERAIKRRQKAQGGDTIHQYLFLSVRGTPLYRSKRDNREFDAQNNLRHQKTGQGVRQFITEKVIPFIRNKNNTPRFHYRFHDTRASFGMNLTDFQLDLVAKGEITLHQAREFVKTCMGHESSVTTDRYLQYRSNLKIVRNISEKYESHLRQLAERALGAAE